MTQSGEEVYSSLRGRFKGDLLRPGEIGYEDARAIWNGMVARTPGLIARCADVADVQNAVRAGSEAGTPYRCPLWGTQPGRFQHLRRRFGDRPIANAPSHR